MNAELEVVVEKIVPTGRGFARLKDGRPVLVANGFPNERVRLRVLADKGSYLEAVGEPIEPSPERVPSPCDVAKACGGCDWMGIDVALQRTYKLDLVREALRRTGGFQEVPGLALVTVGEPLRYRSRIRLKIQNGRIGFHAAGSHELVEPTTCWVSAPELSSALGELREWVRKEARAFEPFAYVEVRRAPQALRCSLFFGLCRGRAPSRATRRVLAELKARFLVQVEGEPPGALERFELEDCYLLAAPGTFTQVNWAVNRALVDEVGREARKQKLLSFADLYCGSGNFSLPLVARGLAGRGVEASEASIGAARRAAQEQGFNGVLFEVGDVASVARRWALRGERFDLVIVDPPRAGAKSALDSIARLAGRAVAMVSCDPVTLARDLRELVARGLVLDRVTAFDMFPQTHHVECLAWLRSPET